MVLHGDHTLQNLPDDSRATSRRPLCTRVVPRVYNGRPAPSHVPTPGGRFRVAPTEPGPGRGSVIPRWPPSTRPLAEAS